MEIMRMWHAYGRWPEVSQRKEFRSSRCRLDVLTMRHDGGLEAHHAFRASLKRVCNLWRDHKSISLEHGGNEDVRKLL
jgi:hypothetical protein